MLVKIRWLTRAAKPRAFGSCITPNGKFADLGREILGMEIGALEAEPFWTVFMRKLRQRGLKGVRLIISDAHEGITAAAAKV